MRYRASFGLRNEWMLGCSCWSGGEWGGEGDLE